MSASKFSDPDMQEIFEGFLIETNELLDSLSQDLMEIEINPDDVDLINRIFRSFHTIKGTSSFMGFAEIAEITHHAEDILNKLRRGELVINQPIIDVLLEVHDWITILINKIQTDDNRPIDYSNTISIIEKLKKSTTEEEEEEAIASALSGSAKSDDADNNALGKVLENEEFAQGPGDFTDEELALLEAAFHESNKQFFNTTLQSESQNIIDDEVYTDSFEPNMEREEIEETPPVKIEDTAKFEKPDKSSNIPNKGLKSKTSAETTIRVDVNRVESLMDLSGELVLGRNRLAQITEKIQHYFKNKEIARELIETTAQVDFVTSEIQAAVMRMRMVPIAKLYQKAPRIVRDLAKEFGKKINLVVKGEETEIDRGIIEELNDPLVHMIRNSCDHGVESVADREAAGK
ncbi:MAG: Histidine kinase, partial [Bacteroidota bacterium]|nr:Histidine kinase [Bacteroidota bacterium]